MDDVHLDSITVPHFNEKENNYNYKSHVTRFHIFNESQELDEHMYYLYTI